MSTDARAVERRLLGLARRVGQRRSIRAHRGQQRSEHGWDGTVADRRRKPADRRERSMTPLERSINGLRLPSPEMSAHPPPSPTQTWIAAIGLALLAATLAADARRTLIVLFGLATALYLLSLTYRLYLLRTALRGVATASISDEDARGLADQDLPI